MSKKLEELILHIAEVCKDDPEFGATKLNKILFISDFVAYSVYGKPITEVTYFHLQNGPAPKEMIGVQEELIAKKEARIEERQYFGRTQKRLKPLRGPDTSMFLEEELSLVKDVINSMKGVTGSQLSDWTHKLVPWILTEQKEEIPYYTTYTMYDVPVRRDGIIWAQKELQRLRESGHGS